MQNHEERYKNFVENYSDLTQRLPQYLIASFVGVKPYLSVDSEEDLPKVFLNPG